MGAGKDDGPVLAGRVKATRHYSAPGLMDGARRSCSPPAMPFYNEIQQMFSLAWAAYAADDVIQGINHDQHVNQEVVRRLADTAPIGRRWRLAWGPATSRFDGPWLIDDNMAYIAVAEDPAEIAVAIRGTNPFSFKDWLFENFDVGTTGGWRHPSAGLNPLLSAGTLRGLQRVEALRSPAVCPLPGTTLFEALRTLLGQLPGARVTVTGHSLGGVLATVFGVLLQDERTAWDPHGDTPLQVWSFAAPTPGNQDFGLYIANRLGGSLHRVWNRRDIVPCAWEPDDLRLLGDTYAGWGPDHLDFLIGFAMRLLARALVDHTQGAVYRQPPGDERWFDWPLRPGHGFIEQIALQHGQAYIDGLGLRSLMSQFDVAGLRGRARADLLALEKLLMDLLRDNGITWDSNGPSPAWARGLWAMRH